MISSVSHDRFTSVTCGAVAENKHVIKQASDENYFMAVLQFWKLIKIKIYDSMTLLSTFTILVSALTGFCHSVRAMAGKEERCVLRSLLLHNFNVLCLRSGRKRTRLLHPAPVPPPPAALTQQPTRPPQVRPRRPVRSKLRWEEPNQLLCQPTWMSSR